MRRRQALTVAFQANFVHHSRGWPQSKREIRPRVVCRLVGIKAPRGKVKDATPTGRPHGDTGRRCSRMRTQAWGPQDIGETRDLDSFEHSLYPQAPRSVA